MAEPKIEKVVHDDGTEEVTVTYPKVLTPKKSTNE